MFVGFRTQISILILILFFYGVFACTEVLASCFTINDIFINSEVKISPKEKKRLIKPFILRCISVEDINAIIHSITNYYMKRGYLTARVEVPEQDLASNVLRLNVIQGKIVEIEYENPSDSSIESSFPKLVGNDVNLRDIEQAIEHLNNLRSNNAKIELMHGGKDGESKLIIRNTPKKRFYVSTGIDSSGDKSKSLYQGFSTFAVDNILSLNDSLILSERHNVENFENNLMQNYNIIWSIPYDYYKVTFNYDYGFHKDKVPLVELPIFYSGNHNRGGINITKNLIRDGNKKLDVNIGFRKSNYKEKINNINLNYQSYKLTVIELGINLSSRVLGGWLQTGCAVEKGLDADATKYYLYKSLSPASNFTKVICDANYYKYLHNFSFGSMIFSSNFKMQHSQNILYASEKFDVGSSNAVRGFNDVLLKSEEGHYVRNELILDLPQKSKNLFSVLLGKPQLFVGLDLGDFYRFDDNPKKRGSLSSTSIGVRTSGGVISTNFVYSKVNSLGNTKSSKSNNIFFSVVIEV